MKDQDLQRIFNEDGVKPLAMNTSKKPYTKDRVIYMVTKQMTHVMAPPTLRGDIIFLAYETENEAGFFDKNGRNLIILKQGNPTFEKDFIKIGVCPININE